VVEIEGRLDKTKLRKAKTCLPAGRVQFLVLLGYSQPERIG